MSVWIPSIFVSQRRLRGAAWEILRVVHDTMPDHQVSADALATLAFEHGWSTSDEIRAVAAGLRRGESIADALANAPLLYPPSVIHAIRLGEKTGCLRQAVITQAEIYEPARRFVTGRRARWRLYLVTLSMIFLLFGTFYSLFVLPMFQVMFEEFGVATNRPLQALITANDSGGLLLLVTGLIGLVVLSLFSLTVTFRDHLLPLLSGAERRRRIGEAIRALSVPLEQGRPASVVVQELAALESGGRIRKRLQKVEASIAGGESLMHSLHAAGMVNERELDALGASTDTRSLAWTMRELADLRAWSGERWVSLGARVIRPIAVLLVAGLVAWCAYAILGNLYSFVVQLA